jgi:hypothetical protein
MTVSPRGRAGVEPDWRAAADPHDLREYDAFGPWIDPIRNERDMPRRFREYWAEHRDARFLLKVPRDRDRADLRPGMDLYETVLAVHSDGVCLLRLDGGQVVSRETGWEQIVATRNQVELLEACWSLLLDDGTAIDLPYNSSSAGDLAGAVGYVHSKITTGPLPGWRPELPTVPVGDAVFTTHLEALRRNIDPPVTPILVERRNRLCRDERNRPRLTTGVLLVDTPAEFVIVNRGEPMTSPFLPSHVSSVTRTPYGGLTSFAVRPPAKGRPSFHVLELRAGAQTIRQWCLDRPDAAIAALGGRGVPQADPTGEPQGLR